MSTFLYVCACQCLFYPIFYALFHLPFTVLISLLLPVITSSELRWMCRRPLSLVSIWSCINERVHIKNVTCSPLSVALHCMCNLWTRAHSQLHTAHKQNPREYMFPPSSLMVEESSHPTCCLSLQMLSDQYDCFSDLGCECKQTSCCSWDGTNVTVDLGTEDGNASVVTKKFL